MSKPCNMVLQNIHSGAWKSKAYFLKCFCGLTIDDVYYILFRYVRLFTQTGQYYRDTGNAVLREQYKDDCALFVFDLTIK